LVEGSRQRPSLVIVGGANGSGKSTFAARANATSLLLGQIAINPDDLTQAAKKEASNRGYALSDAGANLVGVERAEKAVWRALVDDILVFSNVSAEPMFVAERIGRNRVLRLQQPDALPEVTRQLTGSR
jgi:ABC-type cobalamin/Fe3+-siderophores transport system ATPase subunit